MQYRNSVFFIFSMSCCVMVQGANNSAAQEAKPSGLAVAAVAGAAGVDKNAASKQDQGKKEDAARRKGSVAFIDDWDGNTSATLPANPENAGPVPGGKHGSVGFSDLDWS